MGMNLLWLLLLPAIPALVLLSRHFDRKRARKRLKGNWCAQPAPLEPDIVRDIADYWRTRRTGEGQTTFVDDATWNDLSMDEVFSRMNRAVSVPGMEALYAMLRDIGASDEALRARDRRVESVRADESLRLDIQMALLRVNRSHFHGAARFLYGAQFKTPPKWRLYYASSLLMIALIVAGIFFHELFMLAALLGIVHMVVFYKTELQWKQEKCAVRHIASTLNCARRLLNIDGEALSDERRAIAQAMKALRSVRVWLSLFAMDKSGPLDIFTDYLKILFLIDMVSLCAITRGIRHHERELRDIYALVGELDADIAIAQLRETAQVHCRPRFHDALEVQGEALSHPLIKSPVRNDVHWRKNVLVTGSNASGKSTFIKAVALSAIFAQTICTCFARSFVMPRAQVMSSMALKDSVVDGESYFVAEIKSLKRLMDAISPERPLLAFVDEILRGTNTIERIAASSSVLGALTGRNILCMTATHDVELTRILGGAYDNWHFREAIDEGGISFSYRLHEGPAVSRNAIALLGQMGFDPALIGQARASIEAFEQTGQWPAL